MCIASGPFTHGGDLIYQQWHQLLKHIRAAQPDVILLVIRFPYCLGKSLRTNINPFSWGLS